MAEKPVMKTNVFGATLLAYDDRVVIKRRGAFGDLRYDSRGETTFFYNTLIGIDYKKPGARKGYFRFLTPGINTDKIDYTHVDANTVLLETKRDKIYNFILKKIAEAQTASSTNNEADASSSADSFSAADEIMKFKNLLDQGIITKKEFEAKKKQLLDT